jgi:hypothetical protein
LRVGFGGAYALDWNVVFAIARNYGIDVDDEFIRYLQIYECAYINRINDAKGKT